MKELWWRLTGAHLEVEYWKERALRAEEQLLSAARDYPVLSEPLMREIAAWQSEG